MLPQITRQNKKAHFRLYLNYAPMKQKNKNKSMKRRYGILFKMKSWPSEMSVVHTQKAL